MDPGKPRLFHHHRLSQVLSLIHRPILALIGVYRGGYFFELPFVPLVRQRYPVSALWLVLPPAVYFLLVEKVHKAPLKPLRFQPSRQSKETALQKSNGTSSLQMRIVCPARPLLRKSTENTAFSLECRVFAWLGSLLQHPGSPAAIGRTTKGLAGRIQRGVAPLFVSF